MDKVATKGFQRLLVFVRAREEARKLKEDRPNISQKEYVKREAKLDPIVREFRFCNVRRNDDRVSKWVHQNYLEPWKEDPHLWFALVVARLFNQEYSLAAVQDCILPYKPELIRGRLKVRAAMGDKNFNPAYIVSTAGAKMDKIDYVVDRILGPAWVVRKEVTKAISKSTLLDEVHEFLMELNGLASFMAAQVVADLKYAHPEKWSDFDTFAASGPGSKRGINRVYGLDKAAPISEDKFREKLAVIKANGDALLGMDGWEPITAQDWQNCLCEFDKYERARTGEGRPKQLYKPKEII